MTRSPPLPKLYDELADWWPLMSSPNDYEEEAGIYRAALLAHGDSPARTLLELGSGGGNNASYLKSTFEMTLVDPSPGMLAVSGTLNPECAHVQGDMRTVRLDQQFDRVFIHDAICYMASADDLRRAIQTAFLHLRPGGSAVLAPDHVAETFRPETDDGGHDGEQRAMRYLSWSWDPDPDDGQCFTDYAYMLREADGTVRVEHDRHTEGLFPRAEWLRLLAEVGFRGAVVPVEHSEVEPGTLELFIGVKGGD